MSFALSRWDLADVGTTLTEVVARTTLLAGDVVVAMLRCEIGGAREIVDVTTVHRGNHDSPSPPQPEASDLLCRHAQTTADHGWTGLYDRRSDSTPALDSRPALTILS